MVIRYVSNSELRPRQFLTSHNKWQSNNALWFLSHATKKIKNIRPWESKRSFDAQLSGNLTGDTFFYTLKQCQIVATFVACAQLWRPKIFTHGLCHTAIVDFVRISKMFISFHLGKVCRAVNIFAAMSILAMIFESKGRKLRLCAVLSMYYCTWCVGRFLSLANHTFTLKCEEISWHCLFKL